MRAGDSCLRRSLEGLFCKRNLKPSPQEDPRPTFSLWQTEAADRSPLGLPAHLLTVVVHPHGAAEKQWNLLLRERQNCSRVQSEGLFPQQVLSAECFVKTEATFLSGRTTVDEVYDDFDI